MSEVLASLPKWFSERPLWLQTAAIRLNQQIELTDEDISEFVTICKREANKKISKPLPPISALAILHDDTGTNSLHLCSIRDIEGVNALAPKKPLEFGNNNLTVVYGDNGSGKSGYVRLLKHICGAREMGTLHCNVYNPTSSQQKASISFKQNDQTKEHTWSGQSMCDELQNVDIFDSSYGRVFVTSEAEVSYEPPALLFFSSLIAVCEKVASALDKEINRQQDAWPNFPIDQKQTKECIWYEAINFNTTSKEIDSYCTFESSGEAKIQEFQQRLAEQSPADKAKKLRTQKQHADSLIEDTKSHIEDLSDENFRKIIAAKKNLNVKRVAADTAANTMFASSKLEGIGSDIWKELWEAARKYSESIAYKGLDYPNISDDSCCLLCHQALTPEAKSRLTSFENFVKGETEKASIKAANEYDIAIKAIKELPTLDLLKTKIDAIGISHEEIMGQVAEFFDQLRSRRSKLLDLDSEKNIPSPLHAPQWLDQINAHSQFLDENAKKCDEDAKSDNRLEIKKQLESLQARKWLSEHRSTIDKEISRLKLLNELHEARKLANTKGLSQKKGELAEELITDAFVQRFNTELKALNASRVKIELVKSKVSKGKVLHKLQLLGAPQHSPIDVLSEGENRVVSIAAFLADVMSKKKRVPLVFDDPISSLDQTYEEAVVQRLLELSEDKQVIVFTHRLSLLGIIQFLSKKKSIEINVISIRSAGWGTGEPSQMLMANKDITSALNGLINDRFRELRKAEEIGDFDLCEILLKTICSEFRIIVERSIENDLLCGIVQRFQRSVDSLKLKDLIKLKDTDCILLDSLMTKYSRFEHSQSSEAPVNLPEKSELLSDLIKLKEWRTEYKKRSTAADNAN